MAPEAIAFRAVWVFGCQILELLTPRVSAVLVKVVVLSTLNCLSDKDTTRILER